jgi:hypothetical protein
LPISTIVAAYAGPGIASPWHVTDLFLVHYIAPKLKDDSILPQRAKSLAATLARGEDPAGDDAATADETADNTDQPHGPFEHEPVRRRLQSILDAIRGPRAGRFADD